MAYRSEKSRVAPTFSPLRYVPLPRSVVLGLFVTLLLATASSLALNVYLSARELKGAGAEATQLIEHFVISKAPAAQFDTPTAASLQAWQAQFAPVLQLGDIEAFRVWNGEALVVFADQSDLVGQRLPSNALARALEGQEVTEVLRDPVTSQRQLSLYRPIEIDGRILGVYQVRQDYAPIATRLRRMSMGVWIISLLIFGLLYMVMYTVFTVSQREKMAYYDPLTGLANRHLVNKKAAQFLKRANRNQVTTALLYMDLTRFKTVNDSLGHHAGDEILKQVAERIQDKLREEDVVGRLGGDEFAILLADVEQGELAADVARRIQDSFEKPFYVHKQSVHLGINIGIALYPTGAQANRDVTVEQWLTQADNAMYQSKAAGSSFQFYQPEMSGYTLERLQLEEDLRRAVRQEEFVLYFQPLADREGGIIGAEALIRWQHPVRGLVSPLAFIPLAEETGLIREIDRWVIRKALEQNALWTKQGAALEMAINLSPQTFQDDSFAPWIDRLIHEKQVNPALLTLEITENVLANPETSRYSLEALAALGVRIALDDFGTGYSSLAYLESLPIDILKVDRHFIQSINVRATSEAIIKTIITLAQNLGIEALAEGVEKEGQLEWLKDAGSSMFQGYWIGEPVPAEAFPIHGSLSDSAFDSNPAVILN